MGAGQLLPGLHWGTPMACIICAQEDSWGRTIVPRLIAADANLDMVYRVDVVEAGEDMRLTLPVDIDALTSEIPICQYRVRHLPSVVY